jgi:hypothetical protein
MLALVSFNVEKGRWREYKQWVVNHLDKYKEFYGPIGFKLNGVYFAPDGLGPYDVTWIWEFKKFKDLDTADEYDNPALTRLLDQENDFYVPGPMNTVILKNIKESVVAPPTRKKKQKS